MYPIATRTLLLFRLGWVTHSVVHVQYISLSGLDGAVVDPLLDANLQLLLLSSYHLGNEGHQRDRDQEKQPHTFGADTERWGEG